MKHSLQLSFLSTLLLPCISAFADVPPYLETAPVTILWSFNQNFTSSTNIGTTPVPVPEEGLEAIIDPEKLRPVDKITTENTAPKTYSENGDQKFFIKHLIRARLEDYAEEAKTYEAGIDEAAKNVTTTETALAAVVAALNTVGSDERLQQLLAQQVTLTAALATFKAQYNAKVAQNESAISAIEARIFYLKKRLDARWELTAVRPPQTTVEGITTEPYKIFLTIIDGVVSGRPAFNFPTSLTLTPIASVGAYSETLNLGRVTKATGTMTTHFSLTFESFYATDPLYLKESGSRGAAVEGEDYNTSGSEWDIHATGYMTYTIKSTKGTEPAVVPSKIKVTGYGSWHNQIFDTEGFLNYGGTAPLRITIGEAKFQNSNMFPDYGTD